MSVLLTKVIWFRKSNPTVAENITDSLDMSVGRGLDIKNNIATITLKNAGQSFDSSGNTIHRYIDTEGKIMFEEQDQIKVYLKYSDDMAEVESSAWGSDPNTVPTGTTDLKGVYYLIEYNVLTDIKSNPIKIKCADKTYILFNKLLVHNFKVAGSWTAPTAVQNVVRYCTNSEDGIFAGSGDNAGVKYSIDARLTTETAGGDGSGEAGFIQNTRKATSEKGTVNADTTFPSIALAKVWKPVYEWIGELSQIEFLNTEDEMDNTTPIVYGRPFLFYVDEENKFHWFETNDEVSEEITIGTTAGIYSYKLDKKVFDIVNFIVYRSGDDFYGKGTLHYVVDETSQIGNLKMRVIAMKDIAEKLIQTEIDGGNLVANTSGAFTFGGNRYDRKGTLNAFWNGVEYTADAAYNTALRAEVKIQGDVRARNLMARLVGARLKGSIERKGTIQTVGALIKINNLKTGQKDELLRVMDVRDTINKKGWFTSLQVEQDQKAIKESAR